MKSLGKIQSVELREVWKDEGAGFHTLAGERGKDCSMLGEVLGVDLELVETESKVGPYKADIVARFAEEEGGEGHIVVIENQLEATNHDHLGKAITYASGHNAATCVWIAASFSDEHRQAIDWLNENMTERSFFALEIELVRIGEVLPPAPQFNIVSSPNEWAKVLQSTQTQELSELRLTQLQYWNDMLEFARKQPGNQLNLTRAP